MLVKADKFTRKQGVRGNARAPRAGFGGKFSLPLAVAAVFGVVVVLLGGASRIDSLAQIPVGIVSAVVIGVAFASLPKGALLPYRAPLIFLAACLALTTIQLVPLPPSIWTTLPGHAIYMEAATAAGLPQPWRPISISPRLTWAALSGLLTPLAAILALALLGRERSRVLISILLGIAIASTVLGLAQLSGGPGSPLRYYAISNVDAPVGFFANRNHFAFFLAMTIPLLAVWARTDKPRAGQSQRAVDSIGLRPALSLACLGLLIPMILLSGSRAGMALSVALLIPAGFLWMEGRRINLKGRNALLMLAGLAFVAGTIAVTILASRATAVKRLLDADPVGDLRAQYVAPSVEAIKAFFPFGSGFGTFDPVFRRFEPFEILSRKYANHAHNEYLELPIEGGIFAIALVAILLAWWVRRSWRIWISRNAHGDAMAKIGSLFIGTLLVASVGDYPLRTPFMAALFAVSACWMCDIKTVNPTFTSKSPSA